MSTNHEATAATNRRARVILPASLRKDLGNTDGAKVTFTSHGNSFFLISGIQTLLCQGLNIAKN